MEPRFKVYDLQNQEWYDVSAITWNKEGIKYIDIVGQRMPWYTNKKTGITAPSLYSKVQRIYKPNYKLVTQEEYEHEEA